MARPCSDISKLPGVWTLGIAEKIGVPVAVEALKRAV